MPQQPEAQYLYDLTIVPAGWSLATVTDAFLNLARFDPGHAPSDRALEAVSHRLVELWAAQPAEAEAWLERCRELYAKELAGQETRQEELREVLLRHGAAEWGKYEWCDWHFSEAGLLREAPCSSAAEREPRAAWYLQAPYIRDRCRELAERLGQAESQETARKRQKLEEETSERRRLEAELQKSQEEECRDLRDRLAAAEAEVSSKTVELQAAQIESAKCKERCDELAARATGAESAAAGMRQELGQLRDEHGKCQERCQELANRLEAEASEHAKTKELLAQAEFHAAEQQLDVQRLQQDASRGSQDGVQLATGSSKAVLQDRCEQLQQQLAEARGQLEVLWEERGMYKERLRQLAERKTQASYHHPSLHPRGPAPHDAAFGDEEADLAERLGYSLVDEDGASVLSGSFGCSVKQNCFMLDAIFKSRMDFFREGSDLQKGSQVLAGDGKTVLEVVEISKEAQTTKVVDLQAGTATLRVTPDHPVQIPNEGGNAGRPLCMPAGKLKVGEFVMLDSGEAVALTSAETLPMECNVLKIVFKPDLPVAVFSSPSCILSKGHQKLQTRRGVRGRGKDEGASIPDTAAGEYTD